MSISSLRSEIEFSLDHCSSNWALGRAALNDLMRALHETHFKSGCDQIELLSQVQTVLGSTTAHHLANVLGIKNPILKSYPLRDACPLGERVSNALAERGLSQDDGDQFLSHFLKALDEERFATVGTFESPIFMLHFVLGDEAAFHLGGLYIGDALQDSATELEYLDSGVKRFHTLVMRWEMELEIQREEER